MGNKHFHVDPTFSTPMNPVQTFRKISRHAIPYEFNDLFGLAGRLLSAKHPAGRAAMVYSALGLLATPLDLAMRSSERKKYQKAKPPQEPIIFVIGAPRSGTTLVAQSLIKTLPLGYFNNLTSIFPSSPITALKTFHWAYAKDKHHVKTSSLYGRTTRISEPNDALYFWDRWMDKDRKKIPASFSGKQEQMIKKFFGAFEAFEGGPMIQKVNRMNTFAQLVAEILPTAHFVCLDRNPVFHAQSLLIARRFIHGDENKSYGIKGDKPLALSSATNPIQSICHQVLFHKEVLHRQKELIGEQRFIHLPYESFCEDPKSWVKEVANRFLGVNPDEKTLEDKLKHIKPSAKIKIDKAEFEAIVRTFREIKEKGEASSEWLSEQELLQP